jgi:hypothetical protein
MNRKLRNTILAFCATGLVLAVGLMSARPLPPDTSVPGGMIARAEPAATPATDELAARVDARRRQFEAELALAGSLEQALVATSGFVTVVTTDAVLAAALAEGALIEAAGATEGSTPPPRRKREGSSVRSTIAIPYFSFARGTGRGDRS